VQYFQTGYDPVREAISALVYGPLGWIQTSVFFLFALSLLALTVLFPLVLRLKLNAGIIVLALAGIGFIIIGINPSQAPGAELTAPALIHHYTAIAVVFTFPLACFLLAPSLKARGYTGLFYYSLGSGTFFVLFLVIGGIVLVQHLSLVGLFERILLWNGQLWVEIVCARLIYGALKQRSRARLQMAPTPSL